MPGPFRPDPAAADPWTYRYLEACRELGIRNIHIHKGPTIRPLDRDAFDVADVDAAATDFTDLNFVVEHCGLPRLEDFCWIATLTCPPAHGNGPPARRWTRSSTRSWTSRSPTSASYAP
ncbi:amidohydrolase family protein [Streptomyces sp. BBFR51]|uniref:amidohydrolase family protein n=1 Tax=Streptomyces sp. BBFR51 TaxID=3372856 RepID=UPI0037DC8F49